VDRCAVLVAFRMGSFVGVSPLLMGVALAAVVANTGRSGTRLRTVVSFASKWLLRSRSPEPALSFGALAS
jgi:uncharacterized membrane protein YadS